MSDAATDGTRGRRGLGYALVVVAACGWGTWPLILRHAPIAAALQAIFLLAVQALVSLPLMTRDRVRVKADAKAWAFVAWLGVGDAMNVILFFAAYQRTSVAVAVLTHYLAPIFVALAAPFVLGERRRIRTYVSVALAFVGLVMLLAPWSRDIGPGGAVGGLLGAGSAVFYASNVIVSKRLAPVFSSSELMFFHALVAVPLLALFVRPSDLAAVTPSSLWAILGGALGPGTLGGLFFVWGLHRVPASHASTLTLLEPTVAVALAAVFLGERPGPLGLAGALLVLGGATLVVLSPRPPDRDACPPRDAPRSAS